MSDKIALRSICAVIALILLLALCAVLSSRTDDKALSFKTSEQVSAAAYNKVDTRDIGQQMRSQTQMSEGTGANKKGEAGEDASEFWPAIFGKRFKISDTLLVFFTGILAWKTWGLDAATRKLWEAGERQLAQTSIAADAARRSADYAHNALTLGQRAWVTIDAKINEAGVTFDLMGIQVPIDLELRNIGNAIALDVTPRSHVFFNKKHGPRVEEWQKFIHDSTSQKGYFSVFLTPTGLLGDGSDKKSLTVFVCSSPIDAATKEINMREPIVFFIGGCVTYTFASDPDGVRHTGFFFHVRREDGKAILIEDGPIAASDLVLSRDLGTNFFSID